MDTGADLLIQQILACRINVGFGITGTTETPFIAVLNKYYPEFEYKYGLNETGMAAMAKGWSLITDKPSFMIFHGDLGTGLVSSVLFDMKMDYVPSIIYLGMRATFGQYQKALLQGDSIIDSLKPIVKKATILENIVNIPMAIREAYVLSLTPPRGVVVIGIPIDILAMEVPRSTLTKIVAPPTLYFKNRTTKSALNKIISSLMIKEKTLILTGGQIAKKYRDKIIRLAQLTHSSLFVNSRWYNTDPFNKAADNFQGTVPVDPNKILAFFREQHLILSLGNHSTFYNIVGSDISFVKSKTNVIIVTNDTLSTDQPFYIQNVILADPNLVVVDLLKEIEKKNIQFPIKELYPPFSNYDLVVETYPVSPEIIPPDTISPTTLTRSILAALPKETIVILGDLSYNALFQNIIPFEFADSNLEIYLSSGVGLLGIPLPLAIGMKIADPSKIIISIAGDGSALTTIQSLWSSGHECAPIVCIIINNYSFQEISVSTVKFERQNDYPVQQPVGQQLYYPFINFVKLAQSLGFEACRVYEPRDIISSIQKAIEKGRPYLIEIVTKNQKTLPEPVAQIECTK